MNNEERILSLLETMNGRLENLETGQSAMNGRLDRLEAGQMRLEMDVETIKESVEIVNGTVTRIENEHGKMIRALFDSREQQQSQLNRIEKHVSVQDDVILRRVFPVAMNQ